MQKKRELSRLPTSFAMNKNSEGSLVENVQATEKAEGLERSSFLYRWSPHFLGLAVLSLIISGWYRPLTLDYSVRATMIGLFYGILIGLYSRRKLTRTDGLLLTILSLVLILGGFFW